MGKRTFLTLFAAVLANACGTTKFKATSEPAGAELFVVIPGANGVPEKKSIGKTPIEMNFVDLQAAVGEAGNKDALIKVSIEKTGFNSEVFHMPSPRFAAQEIDLNVKLKENANGANESTAKKVLDGLFLAQKLALANQFERAHIELDKIITEFPQFARALSMRASIYYAQQNYPEAVKWYEATLTADPQMEEAVKLLAKAKDMVNGGNRAPSSTPARGRP